MAFIDGTVVNVALPVIQSDLQATVTQVQWVVQAYALFLAALILVGGSMGDHLGRRKVFMAGVIVFTLASVWCGLAPNVNQLIIAQSIKGVGGAMLIPGSLAIISATFSQEQRGRAIGTWSGFTAMTMALGPVLGGWLVENVSWRAVFFVNVPLAVATLVLTMWHVPESRDEEVVNERLDWGGTLLATLGIGGLVYGLTESARLGFQNPWLLLSIGLGLVFLIAFVWLESRLKSPMMPLGLFRSANFSGSNLMTLLLYSALSGALFFFPFNLIQVQGYSPTAAGAAMLPFILILFLLSRWSGGLVERFGAKRPLVLGPVIAALGFALFAWPGVGGAYWTTFFPAVVVLGLGMALSVAPLTTTVMNSVETHQAGVASGVNNAVSRLASLLGVAVLGIIMTITFNLTLDRQLTPLELSGETRQAIDAQRENLAAAQIPPGVGSETQAALDRAISLAYVSGFRRVMLVAAALALASALSAWSMIEGKKEEAKRTPVIDAGVPAET
jgi:EmrB/QacA subfamily drug resistance transporter